MFDPTSRYHDLERASLRLPDGREIAYVRRRFIPRSESLPPLGTEIVGAGDRIDLIAARALGDSEQFWRICDANESLDPETLLVPGQRLRIPLPQP